jgi:ABC-type nitrate/sulfonate/bicarbonate transport system substrate-binding protein
VLRHLARAALLALTLAGAAGAASAEPFRVVAFAGSSNWPFWVAQERGFFAREGLEVALDITPNSVEMARNLQGARYDLALTSIDNVVAYDEGQGEADLGGPVRFVALFGVDDGLLSVVAAPGITTFAGLKGKTLSVDALTTGFAFVLRDILARNGLAEGDVTLTRVGGGAQRLDALLAGRNDGTLLNTPLDLVANARGFATLARARDALGAYQGIVGATTREAVERDRGRLIAFVRAFHAGVTWLRDPANREAATALLAARMRMEPGVAAQAYEALAAGEPGIFRDLRISEAGLRTVLALRSRYAPNAKPLTDPARYVDESVRAEALGR